MQYVQYTTTFAREDFGWRFIDLEERQDLFGMMSYASAVDNLLYIMVCEGFDIANVVEMVSRYIANLGKSH